MKGFYLMNTIKKFIHYYGPYKTVFFIDLICAAVISLIDLAYPQVPVSYTHLCSIAILVNNAKMLLRQMRSSIYHLQN